MPGKTESVSVKSVFPVAGGPSVTHNFNGIPRHIETPSPLCRMLATTETASSRASVQSKADCPSESIA
jgi:hypothetical protein